jgi:hypothetical protein
MAEKENPIDLGIYSPRTREMLEASGLTPEDVHAVEAMSSVFQRRINALFFEEERAPLALISAVKHDEKEFMKSTLHQLESGQNLGSDLATRMRIKPLVSFCGRDVRKWTILKKEWEGRWRRLDLVNFLVENVDLFADHEERFFKLVDFLKYFDHPTSAFSTYKEFAGCFKVMGSCGMLDLFLNTCLENKEDGTAPLRRDKYYGPWAFQLAKLSKLFVGDQDFFFELAGLDLSNLSGADYEKVYQTDKKKFREVIRVLNDLGEIRHSMDGHHLLQIAVSVGGEGKVDDFEEAVHLAKELEQKCFRMGFQYPSNYVRNEAFYGDLPKFKSFCELVLFLQWSGLPDEFARMSQATLEKSLCFIKTKQHYPEVLRTCLSMFLEFEDTLNDASMELIFQTTVDLFDDDFGKLNDTCKQLKKISGLYKNDPEKYKTVVETVKNLSPENFKSLCEVQSAYGTDIEKFKIAGTFVKLSSVVEEKTLAIFIQKFQQDGEAAAHDYLSACVEKSKGMISGSTPDALRKESEYMFSVKRVFPKGNYSDHEKNLSCGDQLGHLAQYHFDRTGYPVEMTGLLGYKLKEGAAEDEAKLAVYQERLGKLRSFVGSRGPDNKALQGAFAEKVDGIFTKNVHETFGDLEGLNVKEKMLALFLTEVIKRAQDPGYKPDPEIADLIVEYKYAFEEDLEAYIRRTADEAQRYKYTASQHFTLWRELSTVYGENVKHVLRNDLFAELSREGGNKTVIEARFASALPGAEELKLKANQTATLEQTFDNERIPLERKAAVVTGQCQRIFGTNIKFSGEDSKLLFERELQGVIEDWRQVGQTAKAYFFEITIPRLFALRQKYVFDVNAKLENLLSYDINQINQELAKFDEVLEVEAKQTAMGGPRHKEVEKSAKKRKIRSYFTKTRETANARMGAYLCIAGDKEMWANPNYFEMVMKDEESGKCVGLTMLLRIDAVDGKKYLWFGPNPFEGFLGQVSSEQCYRHQYEMAARFAHENGFDGVVVPSKEGQILGACTNRGGDFPELIKSSRLRDEAGQVKVVQFGKEHKLGGSYGYTEGALIWEKKAA